MAEPSFSATAITHTTSTSSPQPSSSSQRGGAGRELQGPRPAPLRVRRDSHKIRKQQPPPQVRQPVIIYTVSPRVVHAEPSEFMSVVQRLTGAAPSSSSTTSTGYLLHRPAPAHHIHQQQPPLPFVPSSSFPFQLHQQQAGPSRPRALNELNVGGLPPLPSSILSPVPGSLPAVPPGFFSPPPSGADAGGINLFGELISPAFLDVMTTTTGAASQIHPTVPSPSAAYYWDLFNHHHHHQGL